MANSKKTGNYNKYRDRFSNVTAFRRKKVVQENTDEHSFMSEVFPVVIICAVIFGFIVFYLLFNKYQKIMVVGNDGYFLNTSTLILGSKKNNDDNSLSTVDVKESDLIYKNSINYLVDNSKEKVNIQYPLFFNDGLSIINYHDDVNLINDKFERSTGYKGLVLSYGKAYDEIDYTQIDKEHYLLLSYSDNVMINLYDLKIKTSVNEYNIPVNSFVYFEENLISYYERKGNNFVYHSIKDVDFNSLLTFYYEAEKEEYKYNYEDFLRGIGTVYIKDVVIEEPIEPEKPVEKPEKPNNNNNNNVVVPPGEFVWKKPTVTISDVNPNVYSLTANLKIDDTAGVIVKAPTFTFYRNNKSFLRRTYYGSSKMNVVGLIPDTTFTMTGTYTYLAEDMQTRIVVTFYNKKITTGLLSSLEPVSISFENGPIYPKMIEVNNVKVTSDLTAEALKGVNKVVIAVEDKEFYLANNQVNSIVNGIDTSIVTPESLDSSSSIDYTFKFLDRENNEIKIVNPSGRTRTSKKFPNIAIRVKSAEIDTVTLAISEKNEDNITLDNYIYIVTKSNGEVVKQDYVTSNEIMLTNLDPDQMFTVTLYADIDVDDGNGVLEKYEFSSVSFTSKPITTLGYINLSMTPNNLSHTGVDIETSINVRKTNSLLIKLLQKFIVNLYDESGEELIQTYEITGTDIRKMKEGSSVSIPFDNLESNKKYKVSITTIVQQGSTIYELGTTQSLTEFTTNKIPAKVFITNSFTTETMTDFDIRVEDVDGTIQSTFVRLEFRDKDNKIVDTRKIGVGLEEPVRVTYDKLKTNEFYNIYVYADGYNETNITSNYKSKYLLAEKSIYTESGISGKIELVSSLRVPNSSNIADVRSEVKWYETFQSYTVPKTVDEEGDLHIYSKTNVGAYTYDLSDYHGQMVTVSFKIRAVNPINENYKLFFTQYISGTSSTSYSKELTDIGTETFRNYSFTLMVGNYNTLYDSKAAYPPITSLAYGKNYGDAVGFIFTGGTADLAEYEVRDFEIHVQHERKEYDFGDASVLEQGSWNTTVDVNKAKSNSDFRVRMSAPIYLEGGSRYRFEFDNDTNYTMYMYLFNADTGKYEKAYGWYASGYSIYVETNTYVRFMFQYRSGAGTIEPDDIKNFKIYKYINNNVSGYTPFTYDLVTKIKVNLADKRDEITNNDYFIKIYENGTKVNSYNFEDLVDTSIIKDDIKDIELGENKKYTVELGIKIRDRYYPLSNFEIATDDEVLGISTNNDWVYMQPYGNYILLNDLNFQDFTDRRLGSGYRYFHGTIDFQGYKVSQYTQKTDSTQNTTYYRFYRIETDAVLKNLVLDVNLNNQELNSEVYGLVQYNYGTIENVIININDTMNHQMPQKLYGLLCYYNGLKGQIKNFVINTNQGVHMYADSALLVRENYGLISNGYMYGEDITVDFSLVSGSNRQIGGLTRYNGAKSIIENVFTTVSMNFPNNSSYDVGGIFAYQTYGTIRNSYLYGDTNPKRPEVGPFIQSDGSTAKYENIYYISDNIYTSSYLTKASVSSLYDNDFQYNTLGEGFEIDEMIELGFYPQVRFSTNKMPPQDYVELPAIDTDNYADIIYMNVEENKYNEATIGVSISNPLGETIDDISITNLDTEILTQEYSEGKTELKLRVYNPDVYVSKYEVYSISSKSANGYVSTRKYDMGEKYLMVDLYKQIRTVEDFTNINKGLNQNYILVNDLDFSGYSNFYINNFSGKFEGNNHTISNVNIIKSGKSGIFNQVNGTLQNVTFENIIKNSSSTYHGIVGSSNRYGKFYNVHIKNMTVIIDESYKTANMYIGSLLGTGTASSISYCSASDVTFKSSSEAVGVTIGGLVGNGSGIFINNSFTQNVDINVENSISSNGVGGLLGRESSGSLGSVDSCYSTGKATSNSANVGGLVGQTQGYITNSYSTVDVVSEMSYIGGIAGYTRQSTDVVEKSLYLGNVYSSSSDIHIHRIVGNYTSNENNYAMNTNLVNGVTSDETNGEQVLDTSNYYKAETYQNIFDSLAFDYSQVDKGILPKLYDITGEELLPNQNDNRLYKNLFNIINMVMDKHANDVTVTLYLDNPDDYQIKDVAVEFANVEITRNASQDGISVLEFTMTPELYLDSYRLSSLTYVDEMGEEIVLDRNIKIDSIFYKTLSSFDDWQKISTSVAENYLLTNNIDFTGKTNVKTKVMFNRLETPGDGIEYTISNINLEYTKGENYHNLIQKVNAAMSNVKFDNIKITDKTTGNHSYMNLIMYNYANLKNVDFTNITIEAPNKSYVGIIGINYGYDINNITLDGVNVTGFRYVAGFMSYLQNTVNDRFDNINANNIHVSAFSDTSKNNNYAYYIGGVFGHFAVGISYQDKPIYTNITINNSKIETNGYHVGGITGYGDCNYCKVNNSEIRGLYYVGGVVGYPRAAYQYGNEVRNSKIYGSSYYVGGIYGASTYIYDMFLIDSEVHGTTADTYAVGGISGYESGYGLMYRCGVINSTITNPGDRTGGIVGYSYNNHHIYFNLVDGTTVSGNNKVGGMVGEAFGNTVLRYSRLSDTKVIAANNFAGGVAGYFYNDSAFGSYNEGYAEEISLENVNVQANYYAGGIFGGINSEIYYADRIREMYFSGTVKTLGGSLVGIGSGDNRNVELLKQPRIYVYDKSLVNDVEVKNMARDVVDAGANLLDIVSFLPGYINSSTGEGVYSEGDVYAEYSDFIFLEAGKTYHLYYDYNLLPDAYQIYVYTNVKAFKGTLNSSAVHTYFGAQYNSSYDNDITFSVYQDCYIRINVTRKDRIKKLYFKEVSVPNSVSTKNLVDADDIRDELTWSANIGVTSTNINRIKMNYNSGYWDFSPINKELNTISISDQVDEYTASGKLSSLSGKGAVFSGYEEGRDTYLTVHSYKLPTTNALTLSTKLNVSVSRAYGYVFSSKSATNNYGFGFFVHYMQLYVWCHNTHYATGYYLPYNTDTDISIVYDNKSLIVYVNGEDIFSRSVNARANYDTYDTYIGYDRNYSPQSTSYRFIGKIYDLAIFDRALSEGEIQTNMSSSGFINSTGLSLYYDFTNTGKTYNAYYPFVKTNNVLYPILYQREVVMPSKDVNYTTVPLISEYSLSSKAFENNFNLYSSGLDTINLEFDEISDDLYFIYRINGNEYKTKVENKTYTLQYDYMSDFEIEIKTTFESRTFYYNSSNFAKKILYFGGSYYVIDNGSLLKDGKEIINGVIHLYNGFALLDSGKSYDIQTGLINNMLTRKGVLSDSVPLNSFVLNDRIIKTYYNYTLIDDNYMDGQMFIKDNHVYMFNSRNSLNDSHVFGLYNTDEYQIVLNKDGSLRAYKAGINIPESFANTNINEVTFDINSNETIIMVRYNSNNVLAFNYVTGEELFRSGEGKSVSLFEYLSSSLSTNTYSLMNSSQEYNDSIDFVDLINSSNSNNMNELLDNYVSSDHSASNKLDYEYISVYNPDKNKFDIYSINDIITSNTKKETIVEDDKIVDVESDKEVIENNTSIDLKPVSDKIKSNLVLYDYFYNDGSNSSIKSNKTVIYIGIIGLVIINLFVLMYIYSKKENKYE